MCFVYIIKRKMHSSSKIGLFIVPYVKTMQINPDFWEMCKPSLPQVRIRVKAGLDLFFSSWEGWGGGGVMSQTPGLTQPLDIHPLPIYKVLFNNSI